MKSDPMNTRHHHSWTTTAVTALPPGWRNLYRLDDGTLVAEPCPALLLQEHRSTTVSWDVTLPDGKASRASKQRNLEPPYEVRVVFANADGDGTAWISEADDVGNYAQTIGPGEEVPRNDRSG